jgi:hypothetical protein
MPQTTARLELTSNIFQCPLWSCIMQLYILEKESLSSYYQLCLEVISEREFTQVQIYHAWNCDTDIKVYRVTSYIVSLLHISVQNQQVTFLKMMGLHKVSWIKLHPSADCEIPHQLATWKTFPPQKHNVHDAQCPVYFQCLCLNSLMAWLV